MAQEFFPSEQVGMFQPFAEDSVGILRTDLGQSIDIRTMGLEYDRPSVEQMPDIENPLEHFEEIKEVESEESFLSEEKPRSELFNKNKN